MTAHRCHATAILVALSTIAAAPSRSAAQETDRYRELARRVIQTSAAVKPGEAVMVSGGKHTVPFMEALGMEVVRAGGLPWFTLDSERIIMTFFRELPEVHLRGFDSAATALFGDQLRRAAAIVALPVSENPDALFQNFAGDTVRMAKLMKTFAASQERFDAMRNTARTRFVFIGYPPTKSEIARSGMDSASFDRMIWDAITTDYDRIASQGAAIKRLLDAGKTVRVTTPAGTDFRLTLVGRPAAVMGVTVPANQRNAKVSAHRTVSLPGGQVYVAPLETSANGKVVIPRDNCFGQPLLNAQFEFRNGKMTGFRADSGGTCVTGLLRSSPGPADMVGSLSIGLNPALKPVETGATYHPAAAAGAVMVLLGNNTDLGGKNNTPGGYPFWLARATVEIDGKVVVRDGQVVSEVAGAR